MKVGLIGLGKMGSNLAMQLLDKGHQVVGYDRDASNAGKLFGHAGLAVDSLEQLVSALTPPRLVWVMVPPGDPVNATVTRLTELLSEGDTIVDGGNSHYKDSMRLAEFCCGKGVRFLDAGTSGGMEGARHGACVMVGGDRQAFEAIEPLLADVCVPHGYLYAGASGSGHFLKMVHNGIEYGMMQAIAEGFEVLHKSSFDLNLAEVAGLWSHGSVIRGWLMELTARALDKDAKLDQIQGIMHSSGEGKWTVETALELQASTPVIALSLLMRYRSLETDAFHGKVVAALRNEFGGHEVVKQ
ncbi:decarboxylating 6-phosphogluconate dehydrogenase [Paenibacillus validus]|uniref:Decarboxylating 6-phosphogluconate dehydrogenase n=1 Tax=Paenibacillus validus TaxID=44253 RepID=A0A7X3CTL9_9BACL|nr:MULTISPECIES: decarboxylating 6-phosphogluconate dehydrogenase [Paenibacillus]MED4603513.1 decarboxylating 6-phosphogluconate dehydrogenase [Paenibacillus validus]MED4605360.1 decarboxylating 6-phosphogluconate dehydrogenase [Paenibacillus validus]MUG71232.1 decarboxylating 6-phosphogluconate dehydrogenase [Paenibacillus validus]